MLSFLKHTCIPLLMFMYFTQISPTTFQTSTASITNPSSTTSSDQKVSSPTHQAHKEENDHATTILDHSSVATTEAENLTNTTETLDTTGTEELGTVIEGEDKTTGETLFETTFTTEVENVTFVNGTRKVKMKYKEKYNMEDTLKDIAYYLRAYKFNEYDRRYEMNADRAQRRYFMEFPRPPLRSLHWEVHRYCEPSFSGCIDYLRKKIREVSLKRADDSAVVMQQQNWNVQNNTLQIKQINDECKKKRKFGDILAEPFQGPLERYQWRVTASYFMCWYTMRQVPELQKLNDKCDNFANCLDDGVGPNNGDIRADDSQSFSCALYSFCPDPCCAIKHLDKPGSCWDSQDNPCYRGNEPGNRECSVNKTKNTEFKDIVLNRWNVTCRCPRGHEWNSRFGMCVDVDECALGTHNCDRKLQSCVNLVGSFRCACVWGHIWNQEKQVCTSSKALSLIKLTPKKDNENDKKPKSLIRRIAKFFRRNTATLSVPDKNAFFSILLCTSLFALK